MTEPAGALAAAGAGRFWAEPEATPGLARTGGGGPRPDPDTATEDPDAPGSRVSRKSATPVMRDNNDKKAAR